MRVASQEDERDQQVIPNPHELKHGQRGDGGKPERQHHSSEELALPGAIHPPGLDQVTRDPQKEVPHQEDPERQAEPDMEDDNSGDRSEEVVSNDVPDGVVKLDRRNQRDLEGHDDQGDNADENRIAASPAAE